MPRLPALAKREANPNSRASFLGVLPDSLDIDKICDAHLLRLNRNCHMCGKQDRFGVIVGEDFRLEIDARVRPCPQQELRLDCPRPLRL
jgi:hypothetical protein